jgi:hypothetical protein
MPKTPDDMSQAAIARRVELSKILQTPEPKRAAAAKPRAKRTAAKKR